MMALDRVVLRKLPETSRRRVLLSKAAKESLRLQPASGELLQQAGGSARDQSPTDGTIKQLVEAKREEARRMLQDILRSMHADALHGHGIDLPKARHLLSTASACVKKIAEASQPTAEANASSLVHLILRQRLCGACSTAAGMLQHGEGALMAEGMVPSFYSLEEMPFRGMELLTASSSDSTTATASPPMPVVTAVDFARSISTRTRLVACILMTRGSG